MPLARGTVKSHAKPAQLGRAVFTAVLVLSLSPLMCYVIVQPEVGPFAAALGLLAVVAACFVFACTAFGTPTGKTVVLWCCLLLMFVAYPLKSAVLACFHYQVASATAGNFFHELFLTQNVTDEDLWLAMYTTSGVFACVALILGAYATLCNVRVTKSRDRTHWELPTFRRKQFWVICTTAVLGTVALNVLATRLGILRFGVEQTPLPYRLAGVILLLRQIVDTVLPLAVLSIAINIGVQRTWLGMLLIVLVGIVTGIGSGSKATILAGLAHGLILLAVRRKLGLLMRRDGVIVIANFVLLGIAYAGFSHYVRMNASVESFELAILRGAFEEWLSGVRVSVAHDFNELVGFLYYRLTGVEQIPVLMTKTSSFSRAELWHEVFWRGTNLGTYFTAFFLGIVSMSYSAAPGLIGGAWMMAGAVGVVPLITAVAAGWNHLIVWIHDRCELTRGWDVTIALLVGHVLTLFIDGDFIAVFRPAVIFSLLVKCGVGLLVIRVFTMRQTL
jgi:hypothetical protein